MKCFHFTLRSVVTFQEFRQLRARENLVAAIRVSEQAEIALADAHARHDSLMDLARSGRAFALRAAEHVAFVNALRSATEDESVAEREVDRAHAARDRCLSEYFQAGRALRFLSTLKNHVKKMPAGSLRFDPMKHGTCATWRSPFLAVPGRGWVSSS